MGWSRDSPTATSGPPRCQLSSPNQPVTPPLSRTNQNRGRGSQVLKRSKQIRPAFLSHTSETFAFLELLCIALTTLSPHSGPHSSPLIISLPFPFLFALFILFFVASGTPNDYSPYLISHSSTPTPMIEPVSWNPARSLQGGDLHLFIYFKGFDSGGGGEGSPS